MILHLTSSKAWESAQGAGAYRADSLDEAGFIHCSTEAQLLAVANSFYRDLADPVVLCIDPEKLAAPLRWEPPDLSDPHAGERFPHVYGPINLDAVVRLAGLERGDDGSYSGILNDL